jgi:hypothetical protein
MRCPPVLALAALSACAAPPEGLRATPAGPGPRVVVDFDAEPLPEIPFPNDLATRPDPTSPTGLRLNLPTGADLDFERRTRERLNALDGFGVFGWITVAFDGDLDVGALLDRQRDDAGVVGAFDDDAVYLVDVDPASPERGRIVPLDFQTGRFPQDTTHDGQFLSNDPRDGEPSLLFDTVEEDLDGDGELDPGEDTDDDGSLDHPNVWPPGGDPRLDLLTAYDLESRTLFLQPVSPLRERTRYAVVLTEDLVDLDGHPARSPWRWVNHTRQTDALRPALDALRGVGRSVDDVAFAWTFTTGSVTTELRALTEGVRGRGPERWLRDVVPPGVTEAAQLHTTDRAGPYTLPLDLVIDALAGIDFFPESSLGILTDAYGSFTASLVGGAFHAPDLLFDEDDGGRDDSDEVFERDPTTGRYAVGERRITFTCAIPKAGGGRAPPWPVAIHMHGYGTTRVEFVGFAYALNREGVAVCAIDAPGQGIALTGTEEDLVAGLLEITETQPLWWHLLDDRVRDLDNDGVGDPAGDMLTADPFHTRDMIRQPILDVAQLMESLRTCGTGRMDHVLTTAEGPQPLGTSAVTCDWDGDGAPDLGGPDTTFVLHGVSQGGIMTSLSAAVNEASAAVATVPGGGLVQVGLRTDIDQVMWAISGRALSPLIVGELDDEGALVLSQEVISVDRPARLRVGTLPDWPAGGAVVVRNLTLDREAVGSLPADGRARVPIGANAADPAEKRRLAGIPESGPALGARYLAADPLALGDALQIEVRDASGATVAVFDTFSEDVLHEGVTHPAGSPLVAGSWGLGLRRGSHDLQRVVSVQGLAIEPGDPIAYARRWADEPFDAPTNVMVHLTVGDTSVPEATGVALARAAGLIETERVDARYGATVDAWLRDRGVVHGREEFGPWTDPSGRAILFDPDDLDRGTDGTGAPSEAPLRATRVRSHGSSGVRFLYPNPTGQHAYYVPDEALLFDHSLFAAQQMARFLATGGRELSDDPCLATRDCPFLRPFTEGP